MVEGVRKTPSVSHTLASSLKEGALLSLALWERWHAERDGEGFWSVRTDRQSSHHPFFPLKNKKFAN